MKKLSISVLAMAGIVFLHSCSSSKATADGNGTATEKTSKTKGEDYEKINYNYCFGSSPDIGRMC